jgi:hypothetical protein
MTLDEIKELRKQKTPALTETVLNQQIEKIDYKIYEWVQSRKLLLVLREMINSVSDIDENVITIKHMPAQAIVLGPLNDYSCGRTEIDVLLDFYHDMSDKYPDLDLHFPVWAIHSEENIRNGLYNKPNRHFFYNPDGHEIKPAGLYAIGHAQGKFGQHSTLYERIFDYINESGFEICGNTYKEYPLNEHCISERNEYILRIMVTVRERRSSAY